MVYINQTDLPNIPHLYFLIHYCIFGKLHFNFNKRYIEVSVIIMLMIIQIFSEYKMLNIENHILNMLRSVL